MFEGSKNLKAIFYCCEHFLFLFKLESYKSVFFFKKKCFFIFSFLFFFFNERGLFANPVFRKLTFARILFLNEEYRQADRNGKYVLFYASSSLIFF